MGLLSSIAFVLTAKCRDASRIFSDEHEQQVPSVRKWGARLHLLSCAPCRRDRSQQKLVDQLFEQMPDEVRERLSIVEPRLELSADAAERIQSALKNAANPSIDDENGTAE